MGIASSPLDAGKSNLLDMCGLLFSFSLHLYELINFGRKVINFRASISVSS